VAHGLLLSQDGTDVGMPCDDAAAGIGPGAAAAAVLVPTFVVVFMVAGVACWQKGCCSWAHFCGGCCYVPCLTACARKTGTPHTRMRVATLHLTWDDPATTALSERDGAPASTAALHGSAEDIATQSSLNPLNQSVSKAVVTGAAAKTVHVAAVVDVAPSAMVDIAPSAQPEVLSLLAQKRARRHEDSRQRINSPEFFQPAPGAHRSRSKSAHSSNTKSSNKLTKKSSRKSFHLSQIRVESHRNLTATM
jgi:hypothetical protein